MAADGPIAGMYLTTYRTTEQAVPAKAGGGSTQSWFANDLAT